MVGGNELRELVPAAADHCVGAIVCRDDGAANPMLTSRAYWRRALAEGVAYHLGDPVSGIERVGDMWQVRSGDRTFEAPILINCAGAWGDQIAGHLGEEAPLTPKALTMMVTERIPHFIDPVCGLASGGLSFKQSAEGTLVIGGGHLGFPDRDAETAEPDPLALAASARVVTRVFPQLKSVPVARTWCGLEGFMPDEIPVIGPSSTAPDAYHAFILRPRVSAEPNRWQVPGRAHCRWKIKLADRTVFDHAFCRYRRRRLSNITRRTQD